MLKPRFDQELEFLRDMGGEFSTRYPREAARLGLQSGDPDVERILEGVAFLTARIREDMDGEQALLLNSLLSLFWPDAVRPLPCISVIELRPGPDNMTQTVNVLRDTPLYLEGEQRQCTFRTVYDTCVLPLLLDSVELEHLQSRPGRERVSLRLVLSPTPGASLGRVELGPLRIHLQGDSRQAFGLYYGLTQNAAVSVYLLAESGERLAGFSPASKLRLRPLGFEKNESLMPSSTHTFEALRHLRDYLAFPTKYLFFDLLGLECIARSDQLGAASRLEICIEMDGLPDPFMSAPSKDNVRLHGTPAVNLFPHPGRPLNVDLKSADYRLQPSGMSSHFEIYGVESVTSSSGVGRTFSKRACLPFPAFAEAAADTVFYQVRHRAAVTAGAPGGDAYQPVDVFLSFVDEMGQPAQPAGKIAAVGLLVTNRDYPTQILTRGEQNARRLKHSPQVPASIDPWIIGLVSKASPAPIGKDDLWRFIALALLGWRSFSEPDGLRRLLQLVNAGQKQDEIQRRSLRLLLHELQSVRTVHEDRLVGTPRTLMRGTNVEISLSKDGLAHPGERYLFGAVLNRYLAESAPANTFARLTLRGAEPEIRFPPLVGTQELL